jgi:hypothetical protein
MIDPSHFNDSWRKLEPLISGIVDTHHQMSAADAAQYHELSRAVSGFYGPVVPGITLSDDYRSHVINVMGVGQFFHFLGIGVDSAAASEKALDALKGAAVRLVMNGGRDTIRVATSFDGNSIGWERILESDHKACNYCAMLTGSEGIQKGYASRFHAHDSCYCLARSVFNGQQSANAGIQAEWKSVTTGKQGKAATAAWNQYWSGKDVGSQGASATEPAQEQEGNAPVAAE